MRGKTIMVTGGASGIGAETSARLAREGAFVAIADWNLEQARTSAQSIVDAGGEAIAVACDITDAGQCEAAASAAVERFGGLDGVVNCAGISRPHDSISLPPGDWARMVDVQLNGAFYIAQACAKRMWDNGGDGGVEIGVVTTQGHLHRRGPLPRCAMAHEDAIRLAGPYLAKEVVRVAIRGEGATVVAGAGHGNGAGSKGVDPHGLSGRGDWHAKE